MRARPPARPTDPYPLRWNLLIKAGEPLSPPPGAGTWGRHSQEPSLLSPEDNDVPPDVLRATRGSPALALTLFLPEGPSRWPGRALLTAWQLSSLAPQRPAPRKTATEEGQTTFSAYGRQPGQCFTSKGKFPGPPTWENFCFHVCCLGLRDGGRD